MSVDRSRWFSPAALVLVVVGGAIGVSARAAITLPLEAAESPLVVPAATMAVNLLGSFLLGVLVSALGDRMPRLRAFAGTGVLGGFTTYSAFAVQTVTTSSAAPVVGLVLVVVSLFGGALAAAAGLGLGTRATGEPATGETA